MTAPQTQNRIPLGLREPWQWVQPKGTAEIKQRLLEARDYRVYERERENMCSVAHGEIERLERELSAERERAKGMVPKRLEYRPGLSDYGRGCVAGWNDCIAALLAAERKE